MENATPAVMAPPKSGGSGLAIAGLVLALCGIIPLLGIVTGLAGLVIGIIVLASRRAGKGMAIAAIICGLALPVLPSLAMAGMVYRVVGTAGARQGRVRNAVTLSIIETVATTLEFYHLQIGRYPSNEEGLEALVTKPDFADGTSGQKWNGPYMSTLPCDAWGNEFAYELTDPKTEQAQTSPFKLWSFGPDGQDDGGANDDVVYGALGQSRPGRMQF